MKNDLKKYVAGLTNTLAGIANWRFGVAALLVLPSMVLVAEPAVALGPCTINWIGADGAWESAANWTETTALANRVPNATDTVCIDDASATSVLTITISTSISVLGIDNAEHLVLDGALLTIEAGGEVVNRGTTTLANGYIVGTDGAQGSVFERFVNHGSLVKSGGNFTYIDSPVQVDNTGTISVTDGQLSIGQVGVWPGITYQVSPAALLSLGVNEASDISGVQSVSGGGRVAFNGTLKPVSAPLVLNFPDGGLDPLTGVLDTTVAPITNSGVVHFVNPVIKGVGFTNTGTVRQDASSVPTLDEGAVVTNEGSWSMENAYLLGTSGGVFERFVNHGSLVKSGGNFTYIDSPVQVDNTGTISVTDGQLSIGQVGVWPGITYQVSPAALLSLGVNEASDISGVQSVSGGGRVAFNGTLKPVSAPLVLNFPDGGLDPLTGVLDTTVAPITNSGVVHFVNPVIKGVGFTNTGTVRQDASSVPTLDEGAVVTNEGSWSMENAYLLGTSGGVFERFVNHGSLVKSGGNFTYIDSPVQVDNTGTISVTDGQLSIGQVGVWPGITYQVSPAALLSLGVNEASDISGVQSVSGGGRVAFNGTLKPVSAPLVLNFPDGGLDPLTGVLDTTVAPITNSGVVHFVNPVIKGVGFTNTGTVRQDASSVPTLDEGAVVTNEGSWSMENAYLLGTSGGVFERFVNHGSLVKSGGNFTYIDSPVQVDNTGTISVTDGQLSIQGDVVQVAGGSLVAGTWIATGVLSLPSAGPLTTIGASATVVLDGPTGEFTQLTSLATNRGSFRLSGGRDFTTTGGLTNTGTLRFGPQSTLSVTGDFSTTGTAVFELAGTSATGQFGEIVATGVGALGGAATIVIDAPYAPSASDVFRLGTFADITSPFAVVNGAAPSFTANYTATQFVLNGSGSLPIAVAGADVTVAEATPAVVVVLDGSGSSDVDGTVTSYHWTAPAGVTLTNANTAVAGYTAVDDASFTATLEVCDNDAQCDTDTVNVTVTNVAPFPNAGPDQTANAGAPVPITVTFTDPGGSDTHTATVNWSDGSGLIDVGAVTSGFGLSHTFTVGGTYFVSICVTDDDGGPGCDTVAVVVSSAGNLPPDAVADTGTVRRNSTANILNVLSNDTDPDFDGLTISAFDALSTAGGAVDCSSQFWCYYTPAVGFVGTDTFTYTVSDGQGGVDTATVTVIVVLNQAPVAVDDTETVRRDSLPRDIYVLGNDSDADFDSLTISAFDPVSAAGGTVDCSPFACTYTPPVGFLGTDTFSYTVSDGRDGTDTATVTVQVVPNTAPDARDDVFFGNAPDAPFTIFVRSNDTDADADVITVTGASDPLRGTAVVSADGTSVSYTPDPGVIGTDTFTYTISDGAGGVDTATVTVTIRDFADITNGVVRLGVWDRGNLNIPTGIGLTYVPTGNDSTAPGCPCEGWGAADATTGATGYANESAGTAGIETETFVKTASTAVSTVVVGTAMRVTHDYHPSANPNLYEVTVTVENISAVPVDLRYRRVMDWDIMPTAFSEYVTIERGNAAGILFTSDDGFATANPLAGPSSMMFAGEAVDSGPADHGSLFDFGFGTLAPGATTTFRTYYGAAGNEVDALAALADVGAEAYSLGQPSTVGGPTLGTPNTFVFAFTGVGGGSAFPEAAPGGPYAVQEGNTVTLDGTGSSVPGGTIASYSWTPAGRLTGATTATPSFTATDDETVPITLTVCDDQTPARCDTKSTTLLVTNAVPVVNAGPDMGATAGTAVAVSTAFTDGGTLDTHSATVNWGDGTAVTTIATATSPFSRSHTYAAAGTFTVTVCVTDDDGGVGCDTAVVDVVAANVAPVAVISGPVTVVEGSSIVVSGASSTDSDGTVVSYAWSASAGATLSNASVQAPTLTGRDDASVTLTLTVTDNNGAPHSTSRTVTVTNANPVVNAGPDLAGTVGNSVALSTSFTDAGALDTHTATIDWGDGSALFDVGAVAVGFSRSHTYAAAGTYTVTVCVIDDDGGVGCDTAAVVVEPANVAPVAVISGPVTVVEGSSIVVSGATSTDSDGAVVSYAWSASAGATLSNTSVMAPTLTGLDDASVTLTLTVTDDDGAPHTTSRTVTVTNAVPVVNAGSDLAGTAGNAVPVSTSFTDAGTLDTHTATVDWGDGSALSDVGAVAVGFSRSHTYAVAGTFTINACVTDDDGGVGCDATVVIVSAAPVNVPPVAVISGPVTVVEGSSIVVSGATSTDSDGIVVSYAWSVSAGATLSSASVVAPTLTGRDDASVTLTLTVTDDDGAQHSTSRTVTVTNAVPVVNAGPDLAGTVGDSVAMSTTFTDAGTLDTHTATVDWGDGSAVTDVGAVAVGFSRSHTYTASGSFTVTACVTDDDAGVGCDTTVVVVNARPVAVISGPVTVVEGSSIVVSGASSTDSDGTIVSHAWTVSAGATLSSASVVAPSLTGRDDATVTLTLTVTDDDGAQHATSRTVTVTNANPIVNAGPDLPGSIGAAVAVSTSFADAGTLDTHSATVNWGDGTAVTTIAAATSPFSRSHTYAAAGSFTVTVCVTDDDGGVGCDTTVVTVPPNVPPVAAITGPVTVVEGSSIVVSGTTSTDSDGTVVSYAWTVSAGATLSSASVMAPTLTGRDDASVTLTLTVTDDDGLTHTTTGTVTVTNALPVVNAGPDLPGSIGTAVAVSTSFTDAGALDTHSATVNWGDGTAVTTIAAATSPFSRSHIYAVAGTYTVTVCVTDDDGGVGCDTAVITVPAGPVPPVARITGPVTVVEGSSIVVSGATSTDSDGTIVSYAWSVSAGATLSSASVVAPTLTGRDDASATLTLTVTDADGLTHTTTRTVTVTNANPIVNAGPNLSGTTGVAVAVSTSFTDAGALDTHSATINWGDGTAVTPIPTATSPFSRSHTYGSAGTYTVTVCVTDDNGGVGCDTAVVTISAVVLPRLTINDRTVDEPGTGIRTTTVTVTLAGANALPVTVQYRTVNGTAIGGGVAPDADYAPTTGTLTFNPGSPRTQMISLAVNSDLYAELDERFVVELHNVSTNARIEDGIGTVTINDDGDICTIVGTPGPDVLIGDDGPDVICALAGNDLVDGRGGNDLIFGDAGVDRITFANAPARVVVDLQAGTATGWGTDQVESFEEVVGSAFDDRLSGTDGPNWMVGNSGVDTVVGRGGVDEIFGNDGNDAALDGGLGNDVILGGAGNDRLIGGDGIDNLNGSLGADTLLGDDGNDVLEGEDGIDNLVGGAGVDRMYGGVGADTLAGGAGNDTMLGGADGDTMSGGDDNDTMSGESGIDTLNGNDGTDTMSGGADRDLMSGDTDTDVMSGGPGDDTMSGADGNDTMSGDDGIDTMSGGDGFDTMSGDAGDDIMAGNGDRDSMTGGANNDTMTGGEGNDTMAGNSGNDIVSGNDGNDAISGGDGNDTLHGNGGNDVLAGGDGNDNVFGDAGNDELHGGSGTNHLFGGPDDDYCSFGPPDETRNSC